MREQEAEGEPAHHARRPMNAFLIFCKRHRGVVRDKYPNLENRSITKILGEWWANLEKEEKACYTGLAKQYKDAFFSANPDFKWYKLPAPPLRTLCRPIAPYDKPAEPARPDYHQPELEKTNNNSTKYDYNNKLGVYDYEERPLSMFTPGKLADEAHMGGISSLLDAKTESYGQISEPNPYYSPRVAYGHASGGDSAYRLMSASPQPPQTIAERIKTKSLSSEDSIRELQNALSETTRVFEKEFEDNDKGRPQYKHFDVQTNDQNFTNQEIIDQIVSKRLSFHKDDDADGEFGPNNDKVAWADYDKHIRSGRSCKGKRYQEFMAFGGLLVNKRQKRDYDRVSDEGYNPSCSWEPNSSRSDESYASEEPFRRDSPDNMDENQKSETDIPDQADNNANKMFKAADFDLDAKIKALPSLSLEKFQQKKRDNKRKKKTISIKPKYSESSYIGPNTAATAFRCQDAGRKATAEKWRETIIGSQKRKPRKISITRLEINSMVTSNADYSSKEYKISPQMKVAAEAPATMADASMNVDLCALATLAEVASHTSKIEEPTATGNTFSSQLAVNTSTV